MPIAFVYDAATYGVMMATPKDLEDFAFGFSLTEGIIASAAEVLSLEVVESSGGIELRLWLKAPRSAALAARRRRMAGPTGCGLCGVESLEAALDRPRRRLAPIPPVSREEVFEAMAAMAPAQVLGNATRAVHAAGFYQPGGGLVALREDVGRHNALDKLIGALLRSDRSPAGLVVLTSRVSVEMVQKAAAFGAPAILAVSAPTALAIRTAEAAEMTLLAVARPDAFEIFCGCDRVAL